MSTITILQGLPASGKSTWAKEQVRKSNGQTKRVNKDDLRAMIDAGEWSRENERFVWIIRNAIVAEAIENGRDVIIDDTNFAPSHEEYFRKKYEPSAVDVRVKFFDTHLDVCLERDAKRENPVGEKVIRALYDRYLFKHKNEPRQEYLEQSAILDRAIIVDIDGTLAHMNGRTPFQWDRVGEDLVNAPVVEIVREYKRRGWVIILVSGRDEVCGVETIGWLRQHNIPFDFLHMRPRGSYEKDSMVKADIFAIHIRNKYNVSFVLDDRDQTVAGWRELGLLCLQVAPGNF